MINLKSTSPDVSINAVELRECRFGAKYAVAADTSPDNGNCPPRAVSSSADYLVDRGASDGLTALAKTAAGANVPFIVGQGVVDWTSSKNHELVCDPTHPCALVLELDIGTASGPSEVFQTIKLTFTNDDPLAACGGFAEARSRRVGRMRSPTCGRGGRGASACTPTRARPPACRSPARARP